MILKKFKLIMALSLACAFSLHAQTDNPKLDKFLMKKMKKSGRIGMQAAFITDGELAWEGSYGIKTFQTDD